MNIYIYNTVRCDDFKKSKFYTTFTALDFQIVRHLFWVLFALIVFFFFITMSGSLVGLTTINSFGRVIGDLVSR